MAYSDNIIASQDSTFQGVCQASMINYALGVAAEDSGTTNHTNRIALAVRVMQNPAQWIQQFALAVAVAGDVVMATIRPMSDADVDAAVDTGVAGVWNAIAGVG